MRWSLLTTAALFLGPGICYAQEPDGDGPPQGLAVIVVTAQRQAADLQDTPVAVTALSASQLQERGVQDIRGLENIVPSLQTAAQTNGAGAGSVTFWIRGLGQVRSGNGSEPAAPLYINDFYYPGVAGNVLRAFDIEQVEVLRGPQGTLFGRNSIGGAIRYTTRKPGHGFGGYVEATAGSFDRADVIGAINVPVADWLAVRVTGAALETGGYVDHALDSEKGGATENKLGRIAARLTPTDDITIDLSHEEGRNVVQGSTIHNDVIDGTGGLVARYALGRGTPPYTSAFDSACVYCTPGGLPVDDYAVSNMYNTHFVADWRVSDNLQLKLLSGQGIVTESWSNDVDGSPAMVGRQYVASSRTEALSHELQALGSLTSRLHYVVGLYHYEEDLRSFGGQVIPTGAGPFLTAESSSGGTRTSQSAYANITANLTEALSMTVGARAVEDETTAAIQSISPVTGPISRNNSTADEVLPLLRFQYDWSDDVMGYASVSKGYRGGGFNAINSTGQLIAFGPESVWSYELGARTEWLDGRARINPTAFYTEYNDMQINSQFQPAVGAPTSVLQNAGEAHIYGLELETSFSVTDSFEVNASAALLDGAFDAVLPTAVGVTTETPLPQLPETFLSVGASYRVHMASGAVLKFNADYSWRSAFWGSASNVDALEVDAYGLMNGQAEWESPSGTWALSVFGANLTDEEYFTGALNLTALVGNHRSTMGRPRELGVRLRLNY